MEFREISGKYGISSIRLGVPIDTQRGSELDSIVVVLTQVNEIDIHQNDRVIFEDIDGTEYHMVVAKFIKKYVSFNPVKYDYEVYLMSLTKLFENIPMPSRAVTNIGQNRTVEFYIKQGLDYWEDDYEDNNSGALYPHLDISQTEMPSEFSTMVCPEMAFDTPNLREYLDALYQLKGCICCLKYKQLEVSVDPNHPELNYLIPVYYLSYLDLNERKDAINTEYIEEMYENESADGYSSDIESQINSFISKETRTEYQAVKSEDGYVSEANGKIITDKPIYDLKKVIAENFTCDIETIGNVYGYPDGDYTKPYVNMNMSITIKYNNHRLLVSGNALSSIVDVDLTEYIFIEDIYNALPTAATGTFALNQQYNPDKYKNDTLVWKRGSNTIENLFEFQKKKWILGQNDQSHLVSVLNQAVMRACQKYLSTGTYNYYVDSSYGVASGNYTLKFEMLSNSNYTHALQSGVDNTSDLYKNIYFRIDYIPMIETKFRVEKDANKPHKVISVNSGDTQIDITSFIQRNKELINRSGNPALEFSAVVPNGTNVNGVALKYEIGQTYNDYVLLALEKVVLLESTYYKAVMAKNFVVENMFTQIQRDRRYFSLTSANESVIRHELRTKNILVGWSQVQEEYEIESLEGAIAKRVEWCKISSEIDNNSSNDLKSVVIPDLIAEGGSLIYTISMQDNAIVGVGKNGTVTDNNNVTMPALEYVKYVDENGESKNIVVGFYASIPNYQTFANNNPRTAAIANINNEIPMFEFEMDKGKGIAWQKDNRENLKMSFQLNYKSMDNNIIIGPCFTKLLTSNRIGQIRTDTTITQKTDTSSYLVFTNASSVVKYNGNNFYLKLVPGNPNVTGNNLIVFCDEGLILGFNNFSEYAIGNTLYLILQDEDI